MKQLVIADVHANLPALEAVLAAEPDRDDVVFLGDAVDYGPHPNEVVDRLADLSGVFIAGNHDREAVEDRTEAPPPGRMNFTQWTRSRLSESSRGFLSRLDESDVVSTRRGDIRLHHGDFDARFDEVDVDGLLKPDTDPAAFDAVGELFGESTILFGHSHRQFELTVNGARFVNVGSVGRSNLSGIGAQYAVLDDSLIALRETYYDAGPTIAALEDLPIDENPTIWRRCLTRELFRLRRELDAVPGRSDVAEESRYELAHYRDEFGSLQEALRYAGLLSS